jgi:hypothetical protein
MILSDDPALSINPRTEYVNGASVAIPYISLVSPAIDLFSLNVASHEDGVLAVQKGVIITKPNMFQQDILDNPDNVPLRDAHEHVIDAIEQYMIVKGLVL